MNNTDKQQRTGFRTLLRQRRGQASLIMILIIAMAFVFYAITLNWSRIANLKTTTWMAAVSSSSQAASMFASYGERVLQEQLIPLGGLSYNDGKLKYCKGSFFLLQLLFVIIAAVVAAIFAQYWVVGLIVGTLLTASIVIQEFVIAPMMLSSWNKLYKNLQPVDQYRESSLSSALQQIVNDPVGLPDRFDLNANGKWGYSGSRYNDEIGRFSLYYTERLKLIKPPDTAAFEAFRAGLNNLIVQPTPSALDVDATTSPGLGFNAYCNASNSSSSQCNPTCTGVNDRPVVIRRNNGIGWQYNTNTPITYVPAACNIDCGNILTCPDFASDREYRLLYDPALEIPAINADPKDPQNSFRYRLGNDDEIGKSLFRDVDNQNPISGSSQPAYNPATQPVDGRPAHVKGTVFPMFNEMTAIDLTLHSNRSTVLNQLPGLSAAALSSPWNKRVFNTIPVLNNYHAQDNECARAKDSAQGFFWKKGSDKYCSGVESNYPEDLNDLNERNVVFVPSASSPPNYHYPYNQCQYMYNAGNPEAVDCQNSSNPKELWPQDRMDEMVLQLSNLIKVNKKIQEIQKAALVDTATQWYQQIAPFIAPRCSAGHSYSEPIDQFVQTRLSHLMPFASNENVCHPDEHGAMIQWLYDSTNWANMLDNSMTVSPASGWLNVVYGDEVNDLCYGTVSQIAPCLVSKARYTSELVACDNTFPEPIITTGADGVETTTYPDMPHVCVNLIRLGTDSVSAPEFFTPLNGVVIPTPEHLNGTQAYTTTEATYNILKTWVKDNRIMKGYVRNAANHITKLSDYATATAALFHEGALTFAGFLGVDGPADILMGAIVQQTSSIKRLPSFAIYGWKDDKEQSALWHLARVEVKEPHRLPWVRVYKKGGVFNRKTCYEFTNGNDNVWVRTTRWDEDFAAGTALFANGLPIWQFKFKNPNAPSVSYSAADLESGCIQNGVGIGLTQDTLDALRADLPNNPRMQSNSEEAKKYAKAFMINLDPRSAVPSDQPPVFNCPVDINNCGDESTYATCCEAYFVNAQQNGYFGQAKVPYCKQTNYARCVQNKKNAELREQLRQVGPCFNAADALLNAGVQSMAGARFGVPNSKPWHTGIFFHSASEAKSRGEFNNTTFNDVPTEN